jgi:hypothetical protein
MQNYLDVRHRGKTRDLRRVVNLCDPDVDRVG